MTDTPPVTADLVEAIARDGDRIVAVIAAAGRALNTIAYGDSLAGIKDPTVTVEGTLNAVRSILRDGFSNWPVELAAQAERSAR
jgi:hypothetical protein